MTPIPAAFFSPLPPGVADDPLTFAVSLSGFFVVVALFLFQGQQEGAGMVERPAPLRHPLTIDRLSMLCICLSGVLRNGPDVVLNGLWRGISPATRFELAFWNRILDGASAPFMIAGIILALMLRPIKEFQLNREPIPVQLWLGWRKLAKPVGAIMVGTLIACLLAFLS